MSGGPKVSVVIPAKNESGAIGAVVQKIKNIFEMVEIIVVDDGSIDDTKYICENLQVKVISHPYSMGNGAAIKTGAAHATGEVIIFMDGDGQHDPALITEFLKKIDQGFDMVVGAREDKDQAGVGRLVGNKLYNRLASWVVGHPIADLTSGFRAVRADKFKEFLYLLPNGFSYPTTITMAFFRSGYSICYLPISVKQRIGKSHINFVRDGIRFFLIIFKIGTLYSPLKIFSPLAFAEAALGIGYYLFTYLSYGRFTNMSALLLNSALLIFLIGLVSEQITTLIYQKHR